jgi:hypothetical protein
MSAQHWITVSHLGVKYSDDHISGRCPICRKSAVVADPEKIGDTWRTSYAHKIGIIHDGRKPLLQFVDRCYGTAEHKSKSDAEYETRKNREKMAAKATG